MEKITVATWIPKQIVDDIESAVNEGKYVNKADFIRQAIREKLENEKQ